MANPALHAWDDAALLTTLRDFRGVGNDADLPDDLRFWRGVAALVQRRLVEELALDERRPAFFVLHPGQPQIPQQRTGRRFPMLDNGLERVTGRIWLVNKVANDGTAIELGADADDAAAFALAVDELGVGGLPTVVFDSRTHPPELRFYPNGLADTASCITSRVAFAPITLTEVFSCIDRVYLQQLVTPDVQGRAGKLWEDAGRGWAAEDAEDELELVLRSGLSGAFPTCTVRVEQRQASGRLDIEIEEPHPDDRSQITRHAVLELKVLRGRNSTGAAVPESQVKGWVESGVKQAAQYRNERHALLAALCCFDMRPSHTEMQCFSHVLVLARDMDVELRVWHLFSSSANYRDFLTATQTGAGLTDSGRSTD